MPREWLHDRKQKDMKMELADKLIRGKITYKEKQLIVAYLLRDTVMESALKVITRKLWTNENVTPKEKELLEGMFTKKGKGRPTTGTADSNKMLSLMFKMYRSECKTDIEARKRVTKYLKEGEILESITDDTLRKRIEAGERALSKPPIQPIQPITTSLHYISEKESVNRAILEIK